MNVICGLLVSQRMFKSKIFFPPDGHQELNDHPIVSQTSFYIICYIKLDYLECLGTVHVETQNSKVIVRTNVLYHVKTFPRLDSMI